MSVVQRLQMGMPSFHIRLELRTSAGTHIRSKWNAAFFGQLADNWFANR
jgi:hypothetical protein